jgi:acyl dehydratase
MTARGCDVATLPGLVGHEVVSPWVEVTQQAIDQFAAVTGDRQWIHTDPERARRESPYGGTVAHGFFTLALVSSLVSSALGPVTGARLSVNYGLNKVRFPAAVPSGSRVRGRMTLRQVDAVDGGVQATWAVLVEREGGGDKPCCAAEWLVRHYV